MAQNHEYFGKHILLEKLATGGMAEVFLARAPGAGGIGKFVAIKRILPQFSDSKEFVDMFKDEAKIAINLNHSNIVSIYEFGVEKSQFFLVMDYVEGRNVRQILNKMKKTGATFSIDQIIYMVKEVAAGLDHAHRCLDAQTGKPLNITHRDMSPQNVMVSFEGEIKIVDFGIAKAESQLETTRAGTLKGKFGYMSPEQAEGQPVDLRTDIFSVGIVMWELLANDRLFIANNEINTLRKIRECNVPSLRKINPNIHAELERIVQKALSKDRNLRYQTAAALHRDLNRYLNRQYPDFSHHDFSVFIKTLFADEILETRKRLISYAKIPFKNASGAPPPPKKGDGDTSVELDDNKSLTASQTASASSTFSSSDINLSQEAPAPEAEPMTGLSRKDLRLVNQTKVSHPGASTGDTLVGGQTLDSKDGDNDLAEGLNSGQSSGNGGIDMGALAALQDGADSEIDSDDPEQAILSEGGDDKFGQYANYSISRYTGNIYGSESENTSSKALMLFFTVAFLLVGYSIVALILPGPMQQVITTTDPVLGPLHQFLGVNPQSTEVASKTPAQPTKIPKMRPTNQNKKPKFTTAEAKKQMMENLGIKSGNGKGNIVPTDSILITSNPSGAQITIDGKITGQVTPSMVEVPISEPFSLTLYKDGYIQYQRTDILRKEFGRRFVATLQKAMVGYLDIDVRPPRNARIYINGVKLKENQLPIIQYAVPAGARLKVRAENIVKNTYDEQTVRLKRDQRRFIILKPRKKIRNRSRYPTSRGNQ